jgi:hypothetical protein
MPIAKKKTTKNATKAKSRSNTPRLTPKDVGVPKKRLADLHDLIERKKEVVDDLESNETKAVVQDAVRRKMFEERGGSFYIDIEGGKSLLLKPVKRSYPLSEVVAEKIEETIEDAGFDAGDYYHESQGIKMDADSIYDRMGEKDYGKFQADLAAFMAKRGLGDCWEMTCSIIAKPDFFTSRFGLPTEVNLAIEEIKPMSVSVEAKRSI